MENVAIFGAAGAIGRAAGAELERRGVSFRVVGRSRPKLEQAFGKMPHAEIFPADLSAAGPAAAAVLRRQAANDRVDAAVTGFLVALAVVILLANIRVWWRLLAGRAEPALSEDRYVALEGAKAEG